VAKTSAADENGGKKGTSVVKRTKKGGYRRGITQNHSAIEKRAKTVCFEGRSKQKSTITKRSFFNAGGRKIRHSKSSATRKGHCTWGDHDENDSNPPFELKERCERGVRN